MEQIEKENRNFNLASYRKASESMIATNDRAYNFDSRYGLLREKKCMKRTYSNEEVLDIINSGSLEAQIALSRTYFQQNGYYKSIILYYATLLKYVGILIPNPTNNNSLSKSHIAKRYYNALDYIDNINLSSFLTECTRRALVDGTYYGIIVEESKNTFSTMDLPVSYCRTRFKDKNGNDIIEFDLSYFDSITDEDDRKSALQTYPKIFSKSYRDFKNGTRSSKWLLVPTDIGICFPLFNGYPLLLPVILAAISYEEAVDEEYERDAEGIRKIIVQKIPHLSDGRLVFEPDEAEEMHQGSVQMLKGNKNVSVLTTYADVDSISSNSSSENVDNVLGRIEQNIYSQAGVSGQIFAATNTGALDASIKNDIALMMSLAKKYDNFISNLINRIFSNSNINFKYTTLPVSYQNDTDYIDSSFKLASSGYSFLLPAIAMGISQKDIINIKDLENDVLKLSDKLKPLASSYTQSDSGSSNSEGGRPEVEEQDKSEETIKRDERVGI